MARLPAVSPHPFIRALVELCHSSASLLIIITMVGFGCDASDGFTWITPSGGALSSCFSALVGNCTQTCCQKIVGRPVCNANSFPQNITPWAQPRGSMMVRVASFVLESTNQQQRCCLYRLPLLLTFK